MWNKKHQLSKKALEVAKEKHPDGFTHAQALKCKKEVYGGFGEVVAKGGYEPVKTREDVNNLRNAMAQIDGRYPVGMSDCEVIGINGDCGPDCHVYLDGNCEEPGEMIERLEGQSELDRHNELYA